MVVEFSHSHSEELLSRCSVPSRTHWESVVKCDLREINDRARCAAFSDSNGCLEDVLKVASDVVAAGLVRGQAKTTPAGSSARWAVTPADGTDTFVASFALRIAEKSVLIFCLAFATNATDSAAISLFPASFLS